MRSVYGDTRPPEDLTARARIRDAALDRFAEHGFDGATIRGIAEAAGVSPGLVQHHFGSKKGLRRACDDAGLERVVCSTSTGGRPGSIGRLALEVAGGTCRRLRSLVSACCAIAVGFK